MKVCNFFTPDYYFYHNSKTKTKKNLHNNPDRDNDALHFFQIVFCSQELNFYSRKYFKKSKKLSCIVNSFQNASAMLNTLLIETNKHLFPIFFITEKFAHKRSWLYDFKKITIFLKKNSIHKYLVEKKIPHIFFCVLCKKNIVMKKNINKIIEINFRKCYTICIQKINVYDFFLKNKIKNQSEISKYTRNVLNKISPGNSSNFSSTFSFFQNNIFILKIFLTELFEKSRKNFFYFIFYSNMCYVIIRKAGYKLYICFFGLLYLNSQQERNFNELHIHQKNLKKEHKKYVYFVKKKPNINQSVYTLLKKNYISSKIDFFLINFMDNLVFLHLNFCIFKFIITLVNTHTRTFDGFLMEIEHRICNVKKKLRCKKNFIKISLITYKKIKKIKKKNTITRIKFIGVGILKNLFKFLHSTEVL